MAAVAVALALAGCGGGGGAPATAARGKKRAPKEQLDLYLPHGDSITLGDHTVIRGVTADRRPAKVRLEADPYPFGAFHEVATRMAGRRGRYVFHISPTRNTRYRLVSPDAKQAMGGPVMVKVWPEVFRHSGWPSYSTTSMTLTLRVTAGLRALHSLAYFYVRLPGESSFKRMGGAHLKRVSSTELSATLSVPLNAPNGYRWTACPVRKRAVAGMGLPGRMLNCGAKELAPRALLDGVAFM